ncbi:MAG: glycosyltransferase family 2 protein [Aeriscardovia sp.]|nr:glycosyltransferase family 2 protein [Aeriscardovia sp.]
MCKVSVLVAVYNAEKYLSDCLDSMLNQTLRDIQVICVDDCSTDSSLSILQKYSDTDGRIEVVSLEKNQGLAHARNVALQRAKGEYICMLDADDWYSEDAFEKAVEILDEDTETDCVLFRLMLAYKTKPNEEFKLKPFNKMSGEQAMKCSISWDGIHGLYIVRAAIHKRYPYDETTRVYSDENTSRIHFLKSKNVRACDGIYYYRQNENSVTHKVNAGYFEHLKANESLLFSLKAENIDDETRQQLIDKLWLSVVDCYYYAFSNRQELGEDAYKTGMKEIRSMWKNVAKTMSVSKHISKKIGYMPLAFSWYVFKLQEEIYFRIRKLIKH